MEICKGYLIGHNKIYKHVINMKHYETYLILWFHPESSAVGGTRRPRAGSAFRENLSELKISKKNKTYYIYK